MALVMACIVTALWIRGQFTFDEFRSANFTRSDYGIILDNGRWEIHHENSANSQPELTQNFLTVLIEGENWVGIIGDIPHWVVAVPLTIMSAWLFLSEPRKRQSPVKPATEKAA